MEEDAEQRTHHTFSQTPRSYQLEMLEYALKKNVIGMLPTGSGKTMVAAMLMRELGDDLIRQNKRVVFLAPTKLLVMQQAEVLRIHTCLVVGEYTGDSGIDYWDRKKLLKEQETHEVLVMTPQVFLDVVRRAFISIPSVGLLIFDECHHATKSHPYNRIMQEGYFMVDKALRPHIFGLTASPMNGMQEVAASLTQLEKNLDCTIVTPRNWEELNTYIPRPEPNIVHYRKEHSYADRLRGQAETRLLGVWFSALADLGLWAALFILKKKMTAVQTLDWKAVLKNSDQYCSLPSKPVGSMVREHAIVEDEAPPLAAVLHALHTSLSPDLLAQFFAKLKESEHETRPAAHYGNSFVRCSWVLEAALSLPTPADLTTVRRGTPSETSNGYPEYLWMTDKVQKLLRTLAEMKTSCLRFSRGHHVERWRCIVFTERKATAYAINELIRTTAQLNFLQSGMQTGYSVSDNITCTTQRGLLDAFREGVLNCLVATDVLEEGIDVPMCQLVLMFDLRHNYKSFIQSRGRARHMQAEVVVLSDPDGEQEMLVAKVLEAEEEMRNRALLNAEQMEDAIHGREDEDEDPVDKYDDGTRAGSAREDCYRVEATGAVVTRDSALTLLHEYCSKIPHDRYCTTWAPMFDITQTAGPTFWCTIRLPGHPWFGQTAVLRGVTMSTQVLGVGKSKKSAMAAAGRQAVEILHQHGDLSDYLVPLFTRKDERKEQASLAMDPKTDEEHEKEENQREVKEEDDEAEIIIPEGEQHIWKTKLPRLLSAFSPLPDLPPSQSAAGDAGTTLEAGGMSWYLYRLRRRSPPLPYIPERPGQEVLPRHPMCLVTRAPLPTLPDMTFYSAASTRTIGLRELERSLIFQYQVEPAGEVHITKEQFQTAAEFTKWIHATGLVGHSPNQALPPGFEWPQEEEEEEEEEEGGNRKKDEDNLMEVDGGENKNKNRVKSGEGSGGDKVEPMALEGAASGIALNGDQAEGDEAEDSEEEEEEDEDIEEPERQRVKSKDTPNPLIPADPLLMPYLLLPLRWDTVPEARAMLSSEVRVLEEAAQVEVKGKKKGRKRTRASLHWKRNKRTKKCPSAADGDLSSGLADVLENGRADPDRMTLEAVAEEEEEEEEEERAREKQQGIQEAEAQPEVDWGLLAGAGTPWATDDMEMDLHCTRAKPVSEYNLGDMVYTPHNFRRYFFVQVREDMSPTSPFNMDPHKVLDPSPDAVPGAALPEDDPMVQETEARRGAPKYTNYVEYFKVNYEMDVDPNQPMVECIPTRMRMRGLLQPPADRKMFRAMGSTNAGRSGTIYLPLSMVLPHPCPGDIWRSTLEMAAVMWRLEGSLLAAELLEIIKPARTGEWGSWKNGLVEGEEEKKKLATGAVEKEKAAVYMMLQAITSGVCNEDIDYQRLEILGDAFLKYAVSTYLFLQHPSWHEGHLSSKRSLLTNNTTLVRRARTLNLQQYMRTAPFLLTAKKHNSGGVLRFKAVADCVEAIIGAFLEYYGEQPALELLHQLKIVPVDRFPSEAYVETNGTCAEGVPLRNCGGCEGEEGHSLLSLERLERRLGYKMCGAVPSVGRMGRMALLDEAVTHPTFCTSTPLPCYQRLEFFGDAALDLLTLCHHYLHDRTVSPGYLSEMRSRAVNNDRLSQVAVELGIAHHLRHGSPELHRDVTQYTKSLLQSGKETMQMDLWAKQKAAKKKGKEQGGDAKMAEEEEEEEKEEGCATKALFKVNTYGEGEMDAPKVLADLVEAIAGAVLLDCGLSLVTLWRVYEQLLNPILNLNVRHPVVELTERCAKAGVPCSFQQVTEGVPTGVVEMQVTAAGALLGVALAKSKRRAKMSAAVKGLRYFEEHFNVLLVAARVRARLAREEARVTLLVVDAEGDRDHDDSATATAQWVVVGLQVVDPQEERAEAEAEAERLAKEAPLPVSAREKKRLKVRAQMAAEAAAAEGGLDHAAAQKNTQMTASENSMEVDDGEPKANVEVVGEELEEEFSSRRKQPRKSPRKKEGGRAEEDCTGRGTQPRRSQRNKRGEGQGGAGEVM